MSRRLRSPFQSLLARALLRVAHTMSSPPSTAEIQAALRRRDYIVIAECPVLASERLPVAIPSPIRLPD